MGCSVVPLGATVGLPRETLQMPTTLRCENAKLPACIRHFQEAYVLSLESALYVRIQELPNGPKPLPLQSGFSMDTAYRALGMFNPSETSDAYFILSNDRNETWFICNRHVRTVALAPGDCAFRRPLEVFKGLNPARTEQGSRHPVEPDHGPEPMPPGPQPYPPQYDEGGNVMAQ